MVSATTTIVNREEYYPFGETSFGGFGKKKYRYVGKEKDNESGLYYYGARYYAPWMLRFISVDPLADKYADLNSYNYAGNKPINKIDIDGLQEEDRTETNTPESNGNTNEGVPDEIPEAYMIPEVEIVGHKGSSNYGSPVDIPSETTNNQGYISPINNNLSLNKPYNGPEIRSNGYGDAGWERQWAKRADLSSDEANQSVGGKLISAITYGLVDGIWTTIQGYAGGSVQHIGGANATVDERVMGWISTASLLAAPLAEGSQMSQSFKLQYEANKAAFEAAKSSTATARSLGVAGERAVGIIGSKTRIPSLSGTAKYRIPDGLTSTTLTEVKNVAHQSLTRQLRDFHVFSQQTERQFILYARPNTTFSRPLQNLIDQSQIIVKPIPGL